jgi:hypothetical protein
LIIDPVKCLVYVISAVWVIVAYNFGDCTLNLFWLQFLVCYKISPLVRFKMQLNVFDKFSRFLFLELVFNQCDLILILSPELNMRIIVDSLNLTEVFLCVNKPVLSLQVILGFLMDAGDGKKEVATCFVVVFYYSVVYMTKEGLEFGL